MVEIEWCSLGNGTNVAMYDNLMWMCNALHAAIDYTILAVNAISTSLVLIFPDNFCIPLTIDSTNVVPELEPKRFRGLQIKVDGFLGLYFHKVFDFPKQTLLSIWQAWVAPFDYYISGSNLWPYYDEKNDDIRQGNLCDPVKQFGILTNAPLVIKWTGIIALILKVLTMLGLTKTVSTFISGYFTRNKYNKILDDMSLIDDTINAITTGEIHELQGALESKVDEIKSLIGVRLAFR